MAATNIALGGIRLISAGIGQYWAVPDRIGQIWGWGLGIDMDRVGREDEPRFAYRAVKSWFLVWLGSTLRDPFSGMTVQDCFSGRGGAMAWWWLCD